MVQLLAAVFRAAKAILQKDGLLNVFQRGFSFLTSNFFQYSSIYVYEHTMKVRNEADFLPRIHNLTVKIVSSNQQADELAADGFDFRSYVFFARSALNKGAVAFCIFVDRDLAHVGWVAMAEDVKNYVDPLPYCVNFSNKEACTGGTRTISKYRGKGLMTYGYFLRFEFLRKMGIVLTRNTVATNNISSQRVHAKFAPKIYAKARYVKVLWWQYWKETPLVTD